MMKLWLLLFLSIGITACEMEKAELPHGQPGNRGARCLADQDCIAPLFCEQGAYFAWPVCTGRALQGEPCVSDLECHYTLDQLGLPLRCLDTRVCGFPGGPGL